MHEECDGQKQGVVSSKRKCCGVKLWCHTGHSCCCCGQLRHGCENESKRWTVSSGTVHGSWFQQHALMHLHRIWCDWCLIGGTGGVLGRRLNLGSSCDPTHLRWSMQTHYLSDSDLCNWNPATEMNGLINRHDSFLKWHTTKVTFPSYSSTAMMDPLKNNFPLPGDDPNWEYFWLQDKSQSHPHTSSD